MEYSILLSGGSGKRLWPLSNDKRSKQYIKFLKNSQNEDISMIQRLWGQLKAAGMADNGIICASKAQIEIIKSQLGSVHISVEPDRRDTFPAIALSCAYVLSELGGSENDVVNIFPVDPYTDNTYFETIKKLCKVLEDSNSDVVLMGAVPTEPSSKYGYVIPKENKGNYYTVKEFKEKPDTESAKDFIAQNGLWNCGVFCLRIKKIIDIIKSYGINPTYSDVYNNYDMLPKISFDYEVLEKSKNLAVVPFSGKWQDMGTWDAITQHMDTDITGEGIVVECSSTQVVNELDMPVVVDGIKNAVVVASPDGILVTDKEKSENLKDIVNSFKYEARYEERRWGTITTIDSCKVDDKYNVTRKVVMFAGMNSSCHYHYDRDEIWVFLRGVGRLMLDKMEMIVTPGTTVSIPKGTKHMLKAEDDLEFLEIHMGYSFGNEDINRLTFDWNEALKLE